MSKKNDKKIAALFILTVWMFSYLLLMIYSANHYLHYCNQDSCMICIQLNEFHAINKRWGKNAQWDQSDILTIYHISFAAIIVYVYLSYSTLVSKKIRMDR